MDVLAYITLGHHLIVTAAVISITYYSGLLLFRYKILFKAHLFSLTIIIYLVYFFFWGILTLIYEGYMLVLWRPFEHLYNQRTLFILGFVPHTLLFITPVLDGLLGIDRCLCIIFPLKYIPAKKKLMGVSSLIVICIAYAFVVSMDNVADIMPESDDPGRCIFFGCIMYQYPQPFLAMTKIVTSSCNAVIGIVLFIFIKVYLSALKTATMHKTIFIVIFSTTVFELLPHCVSQAVLMITGRQLVTYIGPFGLTFAAINVAFCTIICCRALQNILQSGEVYPSTHKIHPSAVNHI